MLFSISTIKDATNILTSFFQPSFLALLPERNTTETETSMHPSAPLMTLVTMAAIFYLQVASLFRVLIGWSSRLKLARAARAECMGNVGRTWAALSITLCLVSFAVDALAALGGPDGFKALIMGKSPPRSSLHLHTARFFTNTWALALIFLVVDSALTAAAVAPCMLRTIVTIVPPLRTPIYGPPMSEEDAPTTPSVPRRHEPSLGSSAQLLRVLDVSDSLSTRLLVIALLYALARYGA